ncbi:MAG: hypothetical protein DMF58_11495 [Acidobacteria bacterium]|nr:MAG: hypothetical protein DMF58_11495 [Acidobacteriota bacterium]
MFYPTFLYLLLTVVQIDPQTGLWFPPYASRVQYLSRDPAHPLMADVERAFKENPALADDVCAAFLGAPEPQTAESHDPSVRQFRAMLAMTCSGRQAHARRQTESAQRMTSVLTDLQAMFDQEERPLVTWTREQRERRAAQLVEIVDAGSGPSLRPALQAIALSPSYTFAIHSLLALPDQRLTDGSRGVTRAQAAAFLEQLYRGRASAPEFQAGLPALLLFEGKLDEGRKAADDWYAAAPRERASFARAILAVIDRASGREGALDKVAAGCLPSASWRKQNPNTDLSEYCQQATAMLVINALDVQQQRSPHGLADAAFDLERLFFQDDWPYRLTLVGKAGLVDPAAAQKHFYVMLADPQIPGAAQLDAVYYLVQIAMVHDRPRVAPLVDCWIRLHGINLAPTRPETWKRLMTMTAQQGRKPSDCSGSSADSWCVMHALTMRMNVAVETMQWNVARQTIEKMASITVSAGGSPTPMRTELMDLAVTEIRNGRRAEAVQILSYLKGQPEDGYVTSELARWGEAIPAGASQPWQSPVPVDAALLSYACPPSGSQ